MNVRTTALGFLGGLLAIELVVRLIAPFWTPPLTWPNRTAEAKADQLAERERYPEVVLVGSSLVADGLDPNLLTELCGLETYNAAADGLTPVGLEAWLRQGVLAHGTPEVLIIGVSSRAFRPMGGRNPYVWSQAARTDALGTLDRWLGRWSYLFRYRAVVQDPSRWPPFSPPADDGLDGRGWRSPRDGPYDPGAFAADLGDALEEFVSSEEELAGLRRVLALAQARGVDVVVVDMPTTDDWAAGFPNGQADVDRVRLRVRQRLSGIDVPLVSLADLADPSIMVDPLHASVEGARVFTQALAERWDGCNL